MSSSEGYVALVTDMPSWPSDADRELAAGAPTVREVFSESEYKQRTIFLFQPTIYVLLECSDVYGLLLGRVWVRKETSLSLWCGGSEVSQHTADAYPRIGHCLIAGLLMYITPLIE
jgi:hypothetical protein